MKKKYGSVLKPLLQAAFVFIFLNLFSSCMNMKQGMKNDMTDRGAGIVFVKHDAFSPISITVPVNTTVVWTNKDLWPHTVTSDTTFFDSEKMRSGGTFSYKFIAIGIYNYHCKIHGHMIAKVIVK